MRRRIKFFCTDYSSFGSCVTEPRDALKEEDKIKVLRDVLEQSGTLDVIGRKELKALGIRSALSPSESTDPHAPKQKDYYKSDRITGLVGVIRQIVEHGGEQLDCTLEIRSRFDTKEKPWFLCTMLTEVLQGFDGQEDGKNYVPDTDEDFFAFLLAWRFCNQLKEAYRKGWYRTYVRRSTNDSRLIGTIDAARHIRLNAGRDNGNIACTHRARTEDNALNRLLLCAWEYLHCKFPSTMERLEDEELRRMYTQLQSLFCGEKLQLLQCIRNNLLPMDKPYYAEYEALRKTCLMILRDEGVNLFSGTGTEVEGILFYVPDLWEMYLERHLPQGSAFGERKVQDVKKTGNSEIRPDFVYYQNQKPYYILDAKFKKYNDAAYVLQDLEKLLRDMRIFKVINGGLILPFLSGNPVAVTSHQLFPNSWIHYFTLEIPNDQGQYNDWLQQLHWNTDACMQKIGKTLTPLSQAARNNSP